MSKISKIIKAQHNDSESAKTVVSNVGKVIYRPGDLNVIVDIVSKNGKEVGRYSDKTVLELLQEYPGSVVMDWERALEMIEEAAYDEYWMPAKKISIERYREMLNVLPALYYDDYDGIKAFCVSEVLYGAWKMCFARVGAICYEANREIKNEKDMEYFVEECRSGKTLG